MSNQSNNESEVDWATDLFRRTMPAPDGIPGKRRVCVNRNQAQNGRTVYHGIFSVVGVKAEKMSIRDRLRRFFKISHNRRGYLIHFAKSGKTVVTDGRETLLELALRSGVRISREYPNNHCSGCLIQCLKGEVKMGSQVNIDGKYRHPGWIYACCSYPVSDVVLEI